MTACTKERRLPRRLPLQHRGSAAVEFALVGPLVIMLLFGIAEVGLMLNAQLVLNHAAREGARRAAVDGGATAEVYSKIENCVRLGSIDPDDVDVYISPFSAGYGHTIRLRLSYEYPFKTPVLRAIAGSRVPLRAEVITRSEKASR